MTLWNGREQSEMNGRKAILDSNIIIYLSKGILEIEDIMASYDDLYISIITYLEVMGFRFSDEAEKSIIKYLLNSFEMINIVPGRRRVTRNNREMILNLRS
jgi:predicted nucleic acid-binding protein